MSPTYVLPRSTFSVSQFGCLRPQRSLTTQSRRHAEGQFPTSLASSLYLISHTDSSYPSPLPRDQMKNRRVPPHLRNNPPPQPPATQSSIFQAITKPMTRGKNVGSAARQKVMEELALQARHRKMEVFQTRRWQPGDVYAPHDLSPAEMKKLKRPSPVQKDPFKELNINPLHLYKNYSVMAEFCTPLMKIKGRVETGLGNVNQRRYAKAVRRAVGMGLMPAVHVHPEVLEKQRESVNKKWVGPQRSYT